jgi:hypothetical protein
MSNFVLLHLVEICYHVSPFFFEENAMEKSHNPVLIIFLLQEQVNHWQIKVEEFELRK